VQNRYVADVGDFGKYGLIRRLAGIFDNRPSLRVGVHWYLTPDESHNNDGSKTQYLTGRRAALFSCCDPELHSSLGRIVRDDNRSVDAVRRAGILPASTIFADEPLDFHSSTKPARLMRSSQRAEWMARALEVTKPCDILFADPDNGLECKSVGATARLGPKYAFLAELEPVLARGQTLVVYHHTCRQGTASRQAKRRIMQLTSLTGQTSRGFALLFRRGSSRAFIIVPSTRHDAIIRARVAGMLASPWRQHLEPIGAIR
jgi:hypothetical protein